MKDAYSNRIAGVVVLYSPDPDVVENIRSYCDRLDTLYLVDNSPGESVFVVEAFANDDRIRYHQNPDNLGVASALNFAAARAAEEGHGFLLTMDQDSRADASMLQTLLGCIDSAGEDIAMAAPFLVTKDGETPSAGNPVEKIEMAMTSGGLLRLSAYKAAGAFRDDFFIDFVDVEYCLRLRRQGFSILRDNRAILHHAVGHRVGIKGLTVSSHIPVRSYYKTRNRMIVWRQYSETFPGYCLKDRFRFLLEIGRVICCEPQKIEKFRMIAKGICDYRSGRMGRYVS